LEEALIQSPSSAEVPALETPASQDKSDVSVLATDTDSGISSSDAGAASGIPPSVSSTATPPASASGGPVPGGPAPKTFFEAISWAGKLDPINPEHLGLIVSLDELHRLSNTNCGRQKAYQIFPIAAGMVLRTVYEQALIFRLKQMSLWSTFCATLRPGAFPQLSGIETFVANQLSTIFTETKMKNAFQLIQKFAHRDFLNANIHAPGNIRVTADALTSIAAAGMYSVIQGIIDLA